MKTALRTVYFVVLVILVAFSGLATFSAFAGPGNFRLLVIQSGSMAPSLKPGSMILVWPKNQKMFSPVDGPSWPKFQKGEIITYSSGKESFTHRITSIEKKEGKIFYQTKGDANPGADVEKISEDKVLGKVAFSLPYLGSFIAFTKTQLGLILLIIIPATIIVYSELLKIKEEIQKIVLKRKFSQA